MALLLQVINITLPGKGTELLVLPVPVPFGYCEINNYLQYTYQSFGL